MIDERDWAAMMVPHDLRERVSHITVAALREFGVEVETWVDNGYWLFDCHPHPGTETVVRALNIARRAVGAPLFETIDEYLTYRSWAFANPEKVA